MTPSIDSSEARTGCLGAFVIAVAIVAIYVVGEMLRATIWRWVWS